VETPTYFLLERDHRIDFVPAVARAGGRGRSDANAVRSRPPATPRPPRAESVAGAAPPEDSRRSRRGLFDFERRWAELLFDAVLPLEGPLAGRDGFWAAVSEKTPPYFTPGLRAMVHALTFLPVTVAGFRRPLFSLSRQARVACVERLAREGGPAVQHLLSTVKLLACLAAFEDSEVRRRLGAGPEAPQ
jgi:hypothetical protein